MYQLAIIPLPEGGVDCTVLDSTGEEVILQGSIPPNQLRLPTVQRVFPDLSPADQERILEKMLSVNGTDDDEEIEIPEW